VEKLTDEDARQSEPAAEHAAEVIESLEAALATPFGGSQAAEGLAVMEKPIGQQPQ
jgi:hypothetical protein